VGTHENTDARVPWGSQKVYLRALMRIKHAQVG
jgi:hypothetical protein